MEENFSLNMQHSSELMQPQSQEQGPQIGRETWERVALLSSEIPVEIEKQHSISEINKERAEQMINKETMRYMSRLSTFSQIENITTIS